jgi:hypothetical protein
VKTSNLTQERSGCEGENQRNKERKNDKSKGKRKIEIQVDK